MKRGSFSSAVHSRKADPKLPCGHCILHLKYNSFTPFFNVISQCRRINCFDYQWKNNFHPTSEWWSCLLIGGPTAIGKRNVPQRACVGTIASWNCWECLGNFLLNRRLHDIVAHLAVNPWKLHRESVFNLLWLCLTCWGKQEIRSGFGRVFQTRPYLDRSYVWSWEREIWS